MRPMMLVSMENDKTKVYMKVTPPQVAPAPGYGMVLVLLVAAQVVLMSEVTT